MGLSFEQQKIVEESIGNILVSAAAGSGKTTVLVSRIIHQIINNEDFSVDRILVVTFTREAARNMRDKIDSKIREKIKELKAEGDPDRKVKRLQEQLDLLPNAYIQTIDSFCARVIKEKGYVIADSDESELIEGSNSILDENTLKILLNDAIMQSLLDTYEDEESLDEGFLLLTGMFGNGRTDDRLAENIAYSYNKLRSLPDYIETCENILDIRKKNDEAGVINCLKELIDNCMTVFDSLTDECLDNLNGQVDSLEFVKSKNAKRQEEYHSLFAQLKLYKDYVEKAYNSGDMDAVVSAILERKYIEPLLTEGLLVTLPSIKADTPDEIIKFKEDFGPVAALVDFIKPYLSKMNFELAGKSFRSPGGYGDSCKPYQINSSYMSMLMVDRSTMLELQKQRTSIVEAYIKLLKRTDSNYSMLKARVRGMDFADQSHLAKKILEDRDASGYYRDKFLEIYIDEYQDNSEIQDKIISMFSRHEGNVFRVGDVKQSIYKFRYANPYMFINLMDDYDENPENGKLFRLNANYRSNNQVLEFINKIFEQIMTREGAEIEYDESQMLNYPDGKPVTAQTPVSVTVVDQSDIKYYQAEYYGVLQEVERLCGLGVKYGEICILTRKRKTASDICRYLAENGHPSVYDDEVAIFDDHDIHGICNVIISVGNIYRDEYLLGVMLSSYRYSNFTLGEVSRVILHSKRKGIKPGSQYLYTQLQLFADAPHDDFTEEDIDLQVRVKAFLDWMNDLRNLQIITDIGELTDRIYRDTGILAENEGEEGNAVKFIVFKDWLCTNFIRMGSDIAGIAAELENMKIKLGGNTAVRHKENEKKEAISCMTYHGSKGLEYKAVIVTELYSRSDKDKTGAIKFKPGSGFAVNDFCEENVSISKSIERFFMDEEDIIESNSEGIRLLYVALTRAMDYLSVVLPVDFSGKRYSEIYSRLRRVPGRGIPRQYWLNEVKGIDGAFFAGLVRLKGSAELDNIMQDICGTIGGCCYMSDYDDFILNVIKPDAALFADDGVQTEDGTAETSYENNSDNEDYGDEQGGSGMQEEEYENAGSLSDLKHDSTGEVPLISQGTDANGLPIFAPYPYQEASVLPFKLSVSQLKGGEIDKKLPISLDVNDLSYYIQKQTGEVGESASEVGTFVHSIMRFIDLGELASGRSSYEEQIKVLISEGILQESDLERAMRFEQGITDFANCDVGAALIRSDLMGDASYEKPIVFSVPSDEEDSVLVQGIIDCIFRDEDGRCVLIDYKTDRFADDVTEEERRTEIIRKHSVQINCYASAMEASGFEVKSKLIFLIRYGEFVEIN